MRNEFLIAWQVFVEKSSYLLTGICTGFRKNGKNLTYFSIDKGNDWIYISESLFNHRKKAESLLSWPFFRLRQIIR